MMHRTAAAAAAPAAAAAAAAAPMRCRMARCSSVVVTASAAPSAWLIKSIVLETSTPRITAIMPPQSRSSSLRRRWGSVPAPACTWVKARLLPMRVVHPSPRSTSPNRSCSSQSSAPVLHELGVEHHELLAQDAVGRVVAAVVPVDLANEFRRIVTVPLPAVKQTLSLYKRSGPTHGLATIHTEASLLLLAC